MLNIVNITINRESLAAGSFALIKYSQSLITGTNPKPHQHLTGHSHTVLQLKDISMQGTIDTNMMDRQQNV